jgi:hypothetical protein
MEFIMQATTIFFKFLQYLKFIESDILSQPQILYEEIRFVEHVVRMGEMRTARNVDRGT